MVPTSLVALDHRDRGHRPDQVARPSEHSCSQDRTGRRPPEPSVCTARRGPRCCCISRGNRDVRRANCQSSGPTFEPPPRARTLPSNWKITDLSASQSRAALSATVSNTGCRSNAERLMTFSTSAVAVCCSSDSSRSRVLAWTSSNRRVFSMAIDGLVGEGRVSNSIWRGVKGSIGAPIERDDAERPRPPAREGRR